MNDSVLFDLQLQSLRRARAAALGGADFLHARAADEIEQRLNEVNRTFQSAVIVSHRPDIWAQTAGPSARHIAPDDTLDLEPGAADLVVHALALHGMNDPVGQIIQARRALKPDGLFLAVLLAETTLNELRDALMRAEAEVRGGAAPRVVPMADLRSLGALLSRAGLSLPVADNDRLEVLYQTPLHLMRDLRAMGETNSLAAQDRRFLPRAVLARAAELYVQEHTNGEGRIRATFDLVYLTGWAPHASQPKPLRPGSAQARLADALGVAEQSAGEKPDQGFK